MAPGSYPPHDGYVDNDDADELRALRERAYGPGADIHSDPTALRRLAQLEAGDTATRGQTAVVTAYAATAAAADGEARPTGATSPAPSKPSRGRRVRTVLLWAVSVLVAILLTILVCVLVIRGPVVQVDATAGATEEAALPLEDAEIELPVEFGRSDDGDTRAYADFHGVTPILTGGGPGDPGGECLVIMSSDGVTDFTADVYQGEFYVGCAANAFPAVVAFTVTSTSPERLRDAFPEGTALRFSLDVAKDAVVVFSSGAAK